MTFNPFKFIFTLEGFSTDHTLYDEVKLIRIMNFIKANKEKENPISLIDKEMKDIGVLTGGMNVPPGPPTDPPTDPPPTGPPPAPDQTLDVDIKAFIESAENIINGVTFQANSDKLIINLPSKIAAMAMIARDAENDVKRTEIMLDQLTNAMDYLITFLNNYKTVLIKSKLKTEKNQQNADDLLSLVNEAKQKVDNAKKYTQNPTASAPEASTKFVNESNEKTIEILKEMLTTDDKSLNIAAAKGILAASVAFSAIACLSYIKPDITRGNVVKDGEKLVTDILTKSMNAIYDKIGSSDSTDSTINKKITDTIEYLKKMCTPTNMMEIFMEIIYLIEKPQVSV